MTKPACSRRFLVGAAAIAISVSLAACGDDDDETAVEDVVTDDVDSPTSPDGDAWQFGTLDENGDSYLDTDEVAEGLDRTGIFEDWDEDADSELDADEIAGNAFEHWDADRSGSISMEEWESAARRWYPDGSHVEVFNDYDGDGDSELDADEFSERFDTSILGESWQTSSVDEDRFASGYFELYDTNDDGKVDEGEFTSGSAVWGTPEEA